MPLAQIKRKLTNFSHTAWSYSECIRPDNEEQLINHTALNPHQSLLVRGSGLSYNDSCFNSNGFIIDSERLNHLLDFDPKTGIVTCQSGVLLKDLFLVHPDFIPPVLPGTIHVTVAGSIAHDVHGKNNHHAGSFGHHLLEMDLLIGDKKIRCSPQQHSDLFYATIAGLGLTGIITRATLRLKKASRFVQVTHQRFTSIATLIQQMSTEGVFHDYQVAWLDLLHSEVKAILSLADYCDPFTNKTEKIHTIPPIPFSLIKPWNMKIFNRYFFDSKTSKEQLRLEQFNNPLDKLRHWNCLYGPKGLIQFQAVFAPENALTILEQLVQLIHYHKATATLAVLKLFTQPGTGILSFCRPGFTLAIDFIYNAQAKAAITAMNQLIVDSGGAIYLAKDLLLNPEQYTKIYPRNTLFKQILDDYGCAMNSDLARRLGIKK